MFGSKRSRIVALVAGGGLAAAIGLTTVLSPATAGTAATASLAGAARPAIACPTGIKATEFELYDVTNSNLLCTLKQNTPREIASITKVMTAYVVLTSTTSLSRWITITSWEANWGGPNVAKAGLHTGERLMTRQLLYAMLLPSGADAAAALAFTYGPGTTKFVAKMNAAAAKLGMTHTHFTDFVGLSGDTSSPGDLLKLGQAAMNLPVFGPVFATVVKTRTYSLKALAGHRAHTWTNRNLLLGVYSPYAIGIKTGWTPAAGETLLFMASYNGRVLIGVVLNSGGSSTVVHATGDATRLLNWAYSLNITAPAAVTGSPNGPLKQA